MEEKSEENYTYPAAFCLMQYQCENCEQVETLYNARDGVTPFKIECKLCKGIATHINWAQDESVPEYIPDRGQRIFISMTEEIARIFARYRLKKFEQSESPPPAEGTQERKEIEDSIVENLYHNGEGPCIFVF